MSIQFVADFEKLAITRDTIEETVDRQLLFTPTMSKCHLREITKEDIRVLPNEIFQWRQKVRINV